MYKNGAIKTGECHVVASPVAGNIRVKKDLGQKYHFPQGSASLARLSQEHGTISVSTTYPNTIVIEQKYNESDSDSHECHDPLAIPSTGLQESTNVDVSVLKAMYEGRIDKLQKRIDKVEMIAKDRLAKLRAEQQRTRRLKKKNSYINERLIAILEEQYKRDTTHGEICESND